MSRWGTLCAEFTPTLDDHLHKFAARLQLDIDNREAPTGSEYGPRARVFEGCVIVEGRLRDVDDDRDSLLILGWFAKECGWTKEARLEWGVDGCPSYMFAYDGERITRVRGALDLLGGGS